MLNKFHATTAATLAFLAVGSMGFAQEDVGWVSAEINGEVMVWNLWADQSDWFGPLDSPQTWVSFYTYQSKEGVLPSTFRLSAARVEENWLNTTVDIDLTDQGGHYSSGNVGNAQLEITEATMDGDVLVLVGTFFADTVFKETLSGEPDMAKTLLIEDAEFEVRLPPRR